MSHLANGRVTLRFKKSVLDQKGFSSLYSNFILNLYIDYVIPGHVILPIIFTLKKCLFYREKLTRNDKVNITYNGWGIVSDRKRFWSFDNDTVRNVISLGVNNSSSSGIDNSRNNFLLLGKGPTEYTNGTVGVAEKSI